MLKQFYVSVRPFGFWGPIRAQSDLSPEALADPSESPVRIVGNVCLGMAAISALYLMPMYLVGHWYPYAGVCAVIAAAAIVALKYTWYDYLPKEDDAGTD